MSRKAYWTKALGLWNSLLDWRSAPVLELAALYAQRWEHKLYYRELERQVARVTCCIVTPSSWRCREIAALVLASALLMAERALVAAVQVPVLQESFVKVLGLFWPVWLMLQQVEDILRDRQKNQLVRRYYKQMGRRVPPKRRLRSYLRAVRQPVNGWPGLLHNESVERMLHFQPL